MFHKAGPLGIGESVWIKAKEFTMDRYAKFLLTVIAVSLLWIGMHVGDLIPPAIAANSDMKIEIADISVSSHRALPVVVSGELTCK
jgi:hypothetical protein